METFLTPDIAYILLVSAFVTAVLAILTPGTGVFELIALFAFVLAGWEIYNLPVNYWALGLLILGVFPFLIALKKTKKTYYLASFIGALVIGSSFLFRGDTWKPAVDPLLAIVVSCLTGGFFWIVTQKILEAEFSEPIHDIYPNSLIGEMGETKTDTKLEGSIYAKGELWSARSDEFIPAGERVEVVGRDGFILIVRKADSTE